MMKKLVVVLLVGAPVAACSIGETNHYEVDLPITQAVEVRTCDSAFVAVDTSKLTACGDGKGHCYDGSKVAIATTELTACADPSQVCIPDKVLAANGAKPKSCNFLGSGNPGACTSTLLKQINDNKGALTPDVCAADERCAPCISPLDGTNTGLCDAAGAHTTACIGGTSAGETEACCHGMGACLDQSAIPSDQRDNVSREVCSEGKLCAPASMATGKPKKCHALALSGVCLDICFSAMLKSMKPVIGGDCGPTEVCLPCLIGKGEGMPGCN